MYNIKFQELNTKESQTYIDFFENPTITKNIYLFMLNGGFWLVGFQLLFTIILNNLIKNSENIENIINLKKSKFNFNKLNLFSNIINVLKYSINIKNINYFKNFNQLDLFIQSIFLLFIITFGGFFLNEILVIINSRNHIRFRYNIFSIFIKNISIDNSFDPNKCLNFLHGIFINSYTAVSDIISCSVEIIRFIFLYRMWLIHNKLMRLSLICLLLLQILIMIIIINFEFHNSLGIYTIENNFIFNYESEKLFKMFSNFKEDYFNILKNNIINNVTVSIKSILVVSLGNIVTLSILLYNSIYMLKSNQYTLMSLLKGISVIFSLFYSIPYLIKKLFYSLYSLKINFSKFSLDRNKNTIILNRKNILEKINKDNK